MMGRLVCQREQVPGLERPPGKNLLLGQHYSMALHIRHKTLNHQDCHDLKNIVLT
jgi:hypothetical protein